MKAIKQLGALWRSTVQGIRPTRFAAILFLVVVTPTSASSDPGKCCGPEIPKSGIASWYGESHRGKIMANGQPFDPDARTAASWFYPLGTQVRVILDSEDGSIKSVVVTITDRGPARELVDKGRIIDLAYASFKALGDPDCGLIKVRIEEVRE